MSSSVLGAARMTPSPPPWARSLLTPIPNTKSCLPQSTTSHLASDSLREIWSRLNLLDLRWQWTSLSAKPTRLRSSTTRTTNSSLCKSKAFELQLYCLTRELRCPSLILDLVEEKSGDRNYWRKPQPMRWTYGCDLPNGMRCWASQE